MWRLLTDRTTDPAFNLAVEEAILRRRKDGLGQDTLRVWRNDRSVIVGCHTNTSEEVDLETCRKMGMMVLRRTSGGGAVYQDLGNINYTIVVKDGSLSLAYDVLNVYRTFSETVLKALNSLNIQADFCPPNIILLNGKKISGLAQHRFYDTILFHGTLLVNSDLQTLSTVLLKPKHKVTNISIELSNYPDVEDVSNALAKGIHESFGVQFSQGSLESSEIALAEELREVKYSTDRWNL
jgi:lipoate-protein ligase A